MNYLATQRPKTDLLENNLVDKSCSATRLPLILCLDCSPSMSGKEEYGAPKGTTSIPIDELNKGVRFFFNEAKKNDLVKYSLELSVVAFSGTVQQVIPFGNIRELEAPTMELEMKRGGTSIGQAVDVCLQALERRKQEFKDAGIDYYQPWLVIMTDGEPTDETHIAAAKKASEMVLNKKLSIFPIGIGSNASLVTLKMFSPKRDPLRLIKSNFVGFFDWLVDSAEIMSASTPGGEEEKVEFNTENIKSWGKAL